VLSAVVFEVSELVVSVLPLLLQESKKANEASRIIERKDFIQIDFG
jgi:hypothetical protein